MQTHGPAPERPSDLFLSKAPPTQGPRHAYPLNESDLARFVVLAGLCGRNFGDLNQQTGMADAAKAREVKVVLLGDTGVGKSSLVLRFVTNNFKPYSESTIG